MPVERYFLEEAFKLQEKKILKGAEFHHLAHVMRTRKGDIIELVNGQGVLAEASVQDLFKDHAIVRLDEVKQSVSTSVHVILAQALPKPNRLDTILEKGTELGVNEFWLFPGQLSQKKEIFPSQEERAKAVTIAAMKQCGRLFLPSIVIKPSLDQWPDFLETAFFGDVENEAPLFSKAWSPNLSSIVFVTGPEGGFHSKEIQFLKEKGAKGVKLHDNILRTDTASIMALSLIQHWLMSK